MIKPVIKFTGRWVWRVVAWGLSLALLCLLVAFMAFQFWFLPRANDYRQDIANALAKAAGVSVSIGQITGAWYGWRPGVTLRQVLVKDAQQRDALVLAEVHTQVAWKSIILRELRLHLIEVSGLSLDVRRDAAGRIFVAGIALSAEQPGQSSLGDWLLRQDSIRLSDSALLWTDEKAAGEPLELTQVHIELGNRFGVHGLRLRATPPVSLGAPFTVYAGMEGDLHGGLSAWKGALDIKFPYVNLEQAHRHWPSAIEISQGAGSIEAHLKVEKGILREVQADVAVANVKGKLAPDLAELHLVRLSGGIGYISGAGSMEVRVRDLNFTTPDTITQSGLTGAFSRETDVSGNLETKANFNSLNLAPLAPTAAAIPLPEDIRAKIAALAPRGRLTQGKLRLVENSGRVLRYDISARYEGLTLNAFGAFPGFSGMSGEFRAHDRGGNLAVSTRNGWVHVPKTLANVIFLDHLDTQLNWITGEDSAMDIRVQQASVANADFAGTVTGTYRYAKGTSGRADLQASLTRANASAVWRYVPLAIPEAVQRWLRRALVAGHSRQASITLRGDLADFPFSHGRPGLFEVKAKAERGVLDYVPGWPRVEDIQCDLLLHANRLEIGNANGKVFDVPLRNVTVSVPDLGPHDPVATLRGEASGRTASFLRFLAESPIARITDGFAREVQIKGNGKLVLATELPLRRLHETKIAANYDFTANQLELPAGLGTLSQLTGSLQISRAGVSTKDTTAKYLDGPLKIDVGPLPSGGVEVRASGRAGGYALGKLLRPGWEQNFDGFADWKGRFAFAPGTHERFVVETTLQGLSSRLPAPFNKTAEEVLPVRIEERAHDSGLVQMQAEVGARAALRYLAPPGQLLHIKSGELVFGGKPDVHNVEEKPGLRVSGRIPALDADAWRALADIPVPGAPIEFRRKERPPISLNKLQVGQLSALSRDFGSVTFSGRRAADGTQITVEGKAVSGAIGWKDQGSGQLSLKLARLHLPPSKGDGKTIGEVISAESLPEVQAEILDFWLGERDFGKLDLSAVPEGRLWRLKRLDLVSPEGRAHLQGSYDLRGQVPRMMVDVQVDVFNIGAYFARLKLPPGIKGGKAAMRGNVQWSGAPYALHLPSLSGKLVLDAKQGQFVKVDPGVGKLLGVLSLQALPRRLTLDFRDVFSQGFAFSQISATSNIAEGIATTEDFKMQGASASVGIKGSVNLIRETQDLHVRVLPGLSDGLTVAGTIVNPAIGLAAYLAQKVLKDPVDQLFASDYQVAGTWADPTVSRKQKSVPYVRDHK
ncbi:MAG: YhdP family protein [Burkholderiales bacterium]